MTRQRHARRMRWLVVSFVVILGLAATLQWATARLDAGSASSKATKRPRDWIALNGVEYRPTLEVSTPDNASRRTHQAHVEACDPVSGKRLWRVTIRQGAWPEGTRPRGEMPGMRDLLEPPGPTYPQFLAGFTLTLASRGRALSVTTPDGGDYLVDPATQQVQQLKAPSPPPPPKAPILEGPAREARARGETRCEVHDRALMEGLAPIRYGLPFFSRGQAEARRTRFPHAWPFCLGGCVIAEASQARVLYCPACRDAEREWSTAPHVEPKDDADVLGDGETGDLGPRPTGLFPPSSASATGRSSVP